MLCKIILLISVFQSHERSNRVLKFFKYSEIRQETFVSVLQESMK